MYKLQQYIIIYDYLQNVATVEMKSLVIQLQDLVKTDVKTITLD